MFSSLFAEFSLFSSLLVAPPLRPTTLLKSFFPHWENFISLDSSYFNNEKIYYCVEMIKK